MVPTTPIHDTTLKMLERKMRAMNHPMRRIPFLLLALIALAVAVKPAGASTDRFQFRTEGATAQFSSTDPLTGYITDVTVYAADDQGYRAYGDTGQPERISKVDVIVTQYDPNCGGDGGGKLDAQVGGGGGSDCFYHSMSGTFPGKDAVEGLPEDAFGVITPSLDSAWLNWTLTLVEWGPDGDMIEHNATLSLAWTATGPRYAVRDNWLAHVPPYFVSSGHINAQVREAEAAGTISFRGETHELTSTSAHLFDVQEIRT